MPSITNRRHAALVDIERMLGADGPRLIAVVGHKLDTIAIQAEEIRRLEQQLDEAKREVRSILEFNAEQRAIKDRGALMRKARELSAQGVPCLMRGDYIIHAQTRAVIAQVQR